MARVWNMQTGAEVFSMRLPGYGGANCAALSPNGQKVVASSGWDDTFVWDVENRKELAHLSGHTGALHTLEFSPDGCWIVTSSDDKSARLWLNNRPEYWWGVAWLPEFWLTLLFAGAWVWSVFIKGKT